MSSDQSCFRPIACYWHALGRRLPIGRLLSTPATVLRKLADLLTRHLDLGDTPGAPNPAYKAQTLIASLIAGADCTPMAVSLWTTQPV